MSGDSSEVFDPLGLTEYETTALTELLTLGRTTAPNLSEATDIPKARIYGVLDALSDRGFVEVIPGRPKQYQPKPPEEILDTAVENRLQEYEAFEHEVESRRESFLAEFQPRYESASEDIRPAEELFHVVDVGDASERETRQLYHDAQERVHVITKSFAYFDSVQPAFEDALERGIEISVLFLEPDRLSATNRPVQRELVDRIATTYPAVETRFSTGLLPWRGTLAAWRMWFGTSSSSTRTMAVPES